MLWWMTTASSPSRTAMVTVSLVCSLKRSQTGLAQRRMSRSALTALASSTSPKPSLYFSVAAACSTSPRSLNVVSSRYAVDLWKSSSLATSVTPDHPRRDKNSITETARSTDCTGGLLRTTAHISADPTLFVPLLSEVGDENCGDLPGLVRSVFGHPQRVGNGGSLVEDQKPLGQVLRIIGATLGGKLRQVSTHPRLLLHHHHPRRMVGVW